MSEKPRPSITFVVPALNEEDVIETTVHQILSTVSPLLSEYELILVNDGSTDQTGPIMDRLALDHREIRVLHNPGNIGLGASYQRAIAEGRYGYLMLLCGDGGLPATSLPPIIAKVGTADIVIPYMGNLRRIKTPFRYLLSRTYTTLLNIVFGLSLKYYNGLPVHRLDLLRRINVVSDGFGFQGEILVKLLKSGFSYVEVAVDGAEKTNRSNALRLKSIVSVSTTLFRLFREIRRFAPSKEATSLAAISIAPRNRPELDAIGGPITSSSNQQG
jgi:dolichol-phosphate mannosyltransferase